MMKTAMGDVMREAYKRGWITTRDGNCALSKLRDNKFYITPSGDRKTLVVPENVITFPYENKEIVISADKNPSIELDCHYKLHKASGKETIASLHLHPTHIVAAMYKGLDLQELCGDFPELNRYTKVGPSVPYFSPGSDDLAQKTLDSFTDENGDIIYNIVGQHNHGVMAIGSNPWEAFEHIERLNHICEIALIANKKL